jgi:hypothetical protein
MQKDLVQQMMRRMAAIKPSRPDATPTSTVSPLTLPGVVSPGSVAVPAGSPTTVQPSSAPAEKVTEPVIEPALPARQE